MDRGGSVPPLNQDARDTPAPLLLPPDATHPALPREPAVLAGRAGKPAYWLRGGRYWELPQTHAPGRSWRQPYIQWAHTCCRSPPPQAPPSSATTRGQLPLLQLAPLGESTSPAHTIDLSASLTGRACSPEHSTRVR